MVDGGSGADGFDEAVFGVPGELGDGWREDAVVIVGREGAGVVGSVTRLATGNGITKWFSSVVVDPGWRLANQTGRHPILSNSGEVA